MGTWWYDKDLSAVVTVRGNKVVTVADFGKVDDEEVNAILIAAAPELLDVLIRARDAIEALDGTSVENEKLVDDYRAAIAKATGATSVPSYEQSVGRIDRP